MIAYASKRGRKTLIRFVEWALRRSVADQTEFAGILMIVPRMISASPVPSTEVRCSVSCATRSDQEDAPTRSPKEQMDYFDKKTAWGAPN